MKTIFFKKLVILEPKGRLGNRLQTSAYSLAYAEEYNISLSLCCLSDYEDWFEGTKETVIQKFLNKIFQEFCIFLIKHRKISKLLNVQVVHSCPKSPVILTDLNFHNTILSSFITIVKGYYIYSDPALLFKHKPLIDQFFTPVKIDQNLIKQELDEKRKLFSAIVGVHIRQGDYQDYRGGKYFMSFDHYANLMRSLVHNEPESKIYFLICSDVEIPENSFHDLNWDRGPGDVLGDLYALSICNFVLGTSSTFNRWSAFYGNSRRLEIYQDTKNISFNDFTAVNNLTFPI